MLREKYFIVDFTMKENRKADTSFDTLFLLPYSASRWIMSCLKQVVVAIVSPLPNRRSSSGRKHNWCSSSCATQTRHPQNRNKQPNCAENDQNDRRSSQSRRFVFFDVLVSVSCKRIRLWRRLWCWHRCRRRRVCRRCIILVFGRPPTTLV